MPDTTKDRGIVGESFKEVWAGDAAKSAHEESMKDYPPMPKGMKMPVMPSYELPWTSVGQAPTEKQLENEAYSGSA